MSPSDYQRNDFQASLPVTDLSSPSKRESEVWMRWEYTPEEWALFEQLDFGLISRKYWRITSISILTYMLAGIFAGIFAWIRLSIPPLAIVVPSILLAPLILIIAYSSRPYETAKKRQQARQKQSQHHQVTFSEKAIWEAGAYFPLAEWWEDLRKVEMTDNPPALHFSHREPRSNLSVNGNSSFIDKLHILVPRGHEAEARFLLERYSSVIERRKRQKEEALNPREPN